MADDVTLPGEGDIVATDQVGTAHYQRTKVDLGGDGLSSPLVRGQQTGANSLPVVLASDQALALPSGAATAAHQVTQNTALAAIQVAAEALDNVVAGSELQVDIVTSALPSGAATAANQSTANTALAAIQTAVEALDNTVVGTELQVDVVTSALPSGAATAAKQPALGTAGVSSTDVISVQGIASGTELPVSMSAVPTGGSTAANQTTIIGYVDGIEALLGTIDADTSALFGTVAGSELQVDIVSSALPTGAATAANQSTIISHVDGIEALLATIDTDTSALFGTVAGSELQVDVVAALPAGTNNIGDVDILSIIPGTGATNLGKAIDTATGATDTGVLALVTRDDSLSALTPIEGDNVPLRADSNGALWTRNADVSTASITAISSSVSSAQLLAANAARRGLMLYNTDANGVYVKYGTTASANSFTVLIPANGYWEMPHPVYTGRLDAIWAADGAGSLYATEL